MPPKQHKQGTKGKKQILEENKSTLNFYLYLITGVNGIYYSVYYLLYWDYFSTLPAVMCVLSTVIYLAMYKSMSSMSRPTLHEAQLIDPGADLNMNSGMAECMKDMIILTAITQICSLFWNGFWALLLVAPGYAFYLLWVNILGPWFFAPAEEEQIDEKKQKKMERKMKRQHNMR